MGKLNLSLYGTRDAAQNWAQEYTKTLVAAGFRVGRASPCNFFSERTQVSVTVHGDDFTASGPEAGLRELEATLGPSTRSRRRSLAQAPNTSRRSESSTGCCVGRQTELLTTPTSGMPR